MVKVESILKVTTYFCAVAAFAAIAQYLETPYIAGFAALVFFALLADFGKMAPLPRWSLNLLSLVVVIPPSLTIGRDYLIEPVLNGLVLLMGIKLLEEKKSRDYMQVYLICIFLLIGSTLISFSIIFLLYFSSLFLLSTFALMLLCYFAGDKELRVSRDNTVKLAFQSLIVCSLSIPLCALLFVILPRTDYPLFSFMNMVGSAKSGFSDQVTLGDVSEIQEDTRVAFRVEMDNINEADLYWRGIELDQFDGLSWQKSPVPMQMADNPGAKGKRISQTIYLEPQENRYLFALDRTAAVYPERKRRWRKLPAWHENLQERIRYKAVSVVTDFIPDARIDHERYVRLPQEFSPRIADLANKLAKEDGPGGAIGNLIQFFRSGKFEYSLEDLPSSESPLEEFIFDKKRGNCEYFASALAVMLRSVGIPARLVGGYRGGYYNRAGNYYLILQRNAHVWVEAHDSGGWLRLDPTPVSFQSPEQAYRRGLLFEARLLFDTFNYYWEKLVISYDLGGQLALWRRLKTGIQSPSFDFRQIGNALKRVAGFLPIVALVPLGLFLIRRVEKSPEQKILDLFSRQMAKKGYRRAPAEGLEEFSARISEPELQARVSAFAAEFQDIFYRDRKFLPEQIKVLKSCVRDL